MHVVCERLDDFGRGVGHVSGKVIFVSNLLPLEEARVKVVINKKKYMVGEVVEYLKKSSERVISRCPYENCGCALMNLSYEKSLYYKKNRVISLLKKFASIDLVDIDIVSSDLVYRYRNKVSLKVRNGKIGYFKNGSNDLIEIDRCLILSDRINEIIEVLKKEDLNGVSSIVIKDMDEVLIDIEGYMDISNLKRHVSSIFMNGKLAFGKEKIISSLMGYKFLVSKDSFFQINKGVTEKLYSKVMEYAGNGDKLIDLYCGSGTIGMILSKNYKEVLGIEINKSAVECAKESMKINEINNISFRCGDANRLCEGESADTVVVDPARAGLSSLGIKNILDISPEKIVYVSCNPVTLARDLKELSLNYKLKDICLYDMFPWTYHVESVCLLERK